MRRAVEGDPAEELALDAVGVLEFVDEKLIDPPPHLPPHLGVLGEERAHALLTALRKMDPRAKAADVMAMCAV